jgi:ligand-binding SRPBCC domain-containing protein
MAAFERSVWIDAPVEDVFAFHEREDALALLSPPFPPVRIVSRSGGMQQGARVEVRSCGMRWLALHTAYEKNRLFVDEQIQGPFARWIHRHEFQPEGTGTRLTDRVDYRLKGGIAAGLLFGWAVRMGLERMFRHRHAVTKRICEAAH